MKEFFKKHLFQILVIILVILTGFSNYLLYDYYKKITNLQNEKEVLNQEYIKTKQDLEAANESIKQKDAQLDEKSKEIENLTQSKANTTTTDTIAQAPATTTNQHTSSIYDRISGSDEFKNKIVSALDLLKAQDNEHYNIVSSQVGTIYEYDNYGGYQEKRNIHIGADANPAITAPIIVHEAQHVYNVYVNKIYSYNTKEQELPCYEAELVAAQRVGSPAFFITSIESSISYWQSQ
jgi:hypothetical protein